MEVHAVAGGWVLEWSGATSSSICKTTLSVAGLLVVAGTVVGTVKQHRHRQFVRSCQKRDEEKTEDQNGAVEAGGVRVTRAMAPEMALVDKGGNSRANSRVARVGRGLESVGGMTESTVHRLTNVVGSVVKLPVVLMTKVRGSVSTQPASLPSSLQPVEDRVFQLEIQMKNLEDQYNSKTVAELSLSPRKEKPPISRSLLLDMETEGASVERVQMLEDRLNTRMESIEKAMSAIQDQLAMVNLKPAPVVYQRQESMQHEEYHDAEQQSDNSEALEAKISEATEGTSFGSIAKAVEELDIEKSGDVREPHSVTALESVESKALEAKSGEASFGARSASTTKAVEELFVEKSSDAREPHSLAALGSAESVENRNFEAPGEASGASSALTTEAVEKLDVGRSGDVSEPQLVAELVRRSDEDVGISPASAKGQQLAATLEELHEGSLTEPSAAAAAERFVEIARADNTEDSSMAPSPSESHVALQGEPREVFSIANSDELAQEDVDIATKSPLASTVEDARDDHVKEPLAAAPLQELVAGEESKSALTSAEPKVASKHVELPRAGFEELSQEDRGIVAPAAEFPSEESHVKERALQEDSGAKPQMMTEIFEELSETEPSASFEEPGAVANLPSSVSSEEAQEEFAKDPHAVAEFPQAPVAEEVDDWALASHDPKDVEEPSAPLESVNLKEHAPEDATDESGSMIEESPLSSSKKSEEDVTESSAGASNIEPATEEDLGSERSDMTHASAPSNGADLKESEEDVDESSAGAPSIKPVTEEDSSEDKDLALASSEPEHVQDPGQSAKLKGHAPEDATDESGSMIEESPSSSSKKSQGDVKSSAGAPSVEPATYEDLGESSYTAFTSAPEDGADVKESQEDVEEFSAGAPSIKPTTEEDSSDDKDLALASSEPEHVEDPVQSADLKEHAPEDATDESGSMIEESPSSSSKKSQDDVTESSAGASSMEPAIEEDMGERSDMTLAPKDGADVKESEEDVEESSAGGLSIKPATEKVSNEGSGMALALSRVEEPSAHVESADLKEHAPEDATDESGTMTEELPLSSSKKGQDDVTESSAGASSTEPAAEEDLGEASDMAEPQVASKHMELSSAGFEELAHEDVADTSGIGVDSLAEESHEEDRVKELSAERAPQEESGMALAPSGPQDVEPSAHVESADLGERAPEDATDESGSMVEEAPSSSSKISREDAKESSAGAPSVEPAAEEIGKNIDMAKPQLTPKYVEEVLSASSDSQELATQKDGADEGGVMLGAVAESPLEEVQEVKEDSQELATPEDVGEESETTLASRWLQVPSSFVEKPSAANSEEPDTEASESELPVREALEMEPQAGGDGTALDAQLGSTSEAPPEEFVQGSSEARVNREEEPSQETTGSVHLAAGSPLLDSKAEEAQEDAEQGQTEAESKVADDEQAESTEEASPRSRSTSAPAGSNELKPDTLESESSGQIFFDAEDVEDFEPEQPAHEPENERAHVPEQASQVPKQQPEQELAQVPVHQAPEEPAGGTEHQPAQEREYQPEQVPKHEPSQERAQEPEQEPEQRFDDVPEELPAQVPEQEPAQVPDHQPAQEPDEPARETEKQPAQDREYQPEQERAREPAKERAQEPEQELPYVTVHQPAQETDFKSAEELAETPAEVPEHGPEQDVAQSSERVYERDPAQDDPIGVAPASSEPQAASNSEEHQEQLAEPPMAVAPNVKFDEPAQKLAEENLGGKSAHPAEERGEAPVNEPSVVAPHVEPAQKLAEENLGGKSAHPAEERGEAPVNEPSVVAPHVEPAQEREAEPAQKLEAEPVQEPEAEPAREPEAELAREPEVEPARQPESKPAQAPAQEREAEPAQQPVAEPARQPGVELAREFEGEPARGPEEEPAQERDGELARGPEGEPARGPEVESAQEPVSEPARDHEAEPAQEHEAEPAQEEEEFHDTNEGSGPLEPVNTLEQKSFDGTTVAAGTSSTPLVAGTSDHQNESSKPQVGHTFEEAEAAQVGDHDASSEVQPKFLLQELFLKEPPAAEESIASSESQAAPKSVKFVEEPSVVEPKSQLPEQSVTDTSTTALQAPLTAITEGQQQQHDSLTAIVEETQQQQYEADHDSAGVQIPAEHKGAVEAPTIQLPDATPASQQTETAKDKHARKKGFSRSSSEPKFDYHLHDNRKSAPIQESSLVPTSSTAHQESILVPTSSTAYQDNVDWDVQCLPFRKMSHGEGRPRREFESKSVEDVQSPTTPTNVALEPKLSRRLEKKKEKERRHSFRLEAKQEKERESRRHSLNLDAIDRKGSLASTAEESDTPRAEDVVVKHHKGPFKHLRSRLRHAFSVNKDVTP